MRTTWTSPPTPWGLPASPASNSSGSFMWRNGRLVDHLDHDAAVVALPGRTSQGPDRPDDSAPLPDDLAHVLGGHGDLEDDCTSVSLGLIDLQLVRLVQKPRPEVLHERAGHREVSSALSS